MPRTVVVALGALAVAVLAGCSAAPEGEGGPVRASAPSPTSQAASPSSGMRSGLVGWPETAPDCAAAPPDLFDPAYAARVVPGPVVAVVVCHDPLVPTAPAGLMSPTAVPPAATVTAADGARFTALVAALAPPRTPRPSTMVCLAIAYPRQPHPLVYVEIGGSPSPLGGGSVYRVDVPTAPCTANYTDAVYAALAAVGAVPFGTHPFPSGAGDGLTIPSPSHSR